MPQPFPQGRLTDGHLERLSLAQLRSRDLEGLLFLRTRAPRAQRRFTKPLLEHPLGPAFYDRRRKPCSLRFGPRLPTVFGHGINPCVALLNANCLTDIVMPTPQAD